MRRIVQISAILGMSTFLAGCGIGLGLFPKSSYETLHPKPYRDYWTRSDMTEEGRRTDWVACGGKSNGSVTPDSRFLGEEDDFAAMDRAYRKLKVCMNSKGYLHSTN